MAYFIGLMSGTSLDGVDIALVDVSTQSSRLIAAETYAFDPALRDKLQKLINQKVCSLTQLGQTNIELGLFMAQLVNDFLAKQNSSSQQIIAIGNHGQTIYHAPNVSFPFSLQIGDCNSIAELTKITTVGDFRQRDMVMKGQGAPLVPAFHAAQFQHKVESRAIINIGGIANITYLPANNHQDILGFDTGPGNTLLNSWIERHQQCAYDANGEWAASGYCDDELLHQLLKDSYFRQNIPKSTGREYFNLNWLDKQLGKTHRYISDTDVQATLLHLTAHTIANALKTYCSDIETCYICGGGAHNPVLMNLLQSLMADVNITTTEALGIAPDWVEATAFAWLAYKTLHQQTANVPSVTGAKKAVILGAIYSSNDASYSDSVNKESSCEISSAASLNNQPSPNAS